MPSTTVIIPVFNQSALTVRCLRAILDQHVSDVVVVDDGSTDNTAQVLADFGNAVTVVSHPENRGFAAACNSGAQTAKSEYLLFLNNDTVPAPGWVTALESYAAKHPNASAVGSKLVYPDGRVQHAGVVICQDRYPRHLYSGFPANHPAVNKARRFQIVTAASMLVLARVFERERGFDTAFRNGFEDVDFCLRLGAHGHEVHYCPESVVEHLESVSAGRFKHDSQNVALYRERWLDRVQPDDLRYYIEDDLLSLSYEGQYPIDLSISPLLATVGTSSRRLELEGLLKQASRKVAELSRENTRLSLELGRTGQDSPSLAYQQLRSRIRELASNFLPKGATVLVISKGDSSLLELPGRKGWHFPQTDRGAYAGHHPADSAEAVSQLEALRHKGAEYLLIPETARWWLDHYSGLRQHLDARCTRLEVPEEACIIYRLDRVGTRGRPVPAPTPALTLATEELRTTGNLAEVEHSAAA
jgi:GT2 family glycosyltransferase